MIEKIPFGKTGHLSTRVIFGAAALGGMKQDKADPILDILLEFGINHIDTAAAYGDSELRIAPRMGRLFFLDLSKLVREFGRRSSGTLKTFFRFGVNQKW
jgi:hypothetical protein